METLFSSKSNQEPDSSSNMDTSPEIAETLSHEGSSHPADPQHDQEPELHVSVEAESVETNRVGNAERAIVHSPEQQATEHNHVPASEASELEETDPLQTQRPWTGRDFETSLHFAERVTSCPRSSSSSPIRGTAEPLFERDAVLSPGPAIRSTARADPASTAGSLSRANGVDRRAIARVLLARVDRNRDPMFYGPVNRAVEDDRPWGLRSCKHGRMNRVPLVDPHEVCDCCGRRPALGWLYQCSVDEPGFGDPNGARDGEVLSSWMVDSIKAGKYTDAQKKTLLEQKLNVFRRAYEEKVAYNLRYSGATVFPSMHRAEEDQNTDSDDDGPHVQLIEDVQQSRSSSANSASSTTQAAGNDETGRVKHIEDIQQNACRSPDSTTPGVLPVGDSDTCAPPLRSIPHCKWRACHRCVPAHMDRAWESINAVCKPDFPIPGAYNLGERVVVNAVFVSNLGQRPNPSPAPPPPVPRYYGGESQSARHAVTSYRGVARLSSYITNAATGSTSQGSSSASRVTSPASRSTVDLPSYMSTSTDDAAGSSSQSSYTSSPTGDSSSRTTSVLPSYPIARHNNTPQSTHHLPPRPPTPTPALSSHTTGLPSYPVTASTSHFHGPNSHPAAAAANFYPPPIYRLQGARAALQIILKPLGRSLPPAPVDDTVDASSVWVNIGNEVRRKRREKRYGKILWRRYRHVQPGPCPRGPRGPCPFPMAPGYLMAADPEEVREERELFRFGQMVERERCINSGLHVWEDVMPVIQEVEDWVEEAEGEEGDTSEEEMSEEEMGEEEEASEEEASKDKGKGKLEQVYKGDDCYEGTSDSEDSVGSDESDFVDPILIL